MIAVSNVSRKTIKKTGTAKTLTVIIADLCTQRRIKSTKDEEVEVDCRSFTATRALKSKSVVATFLGASSLLSLEGSDYATGSD